MSNTKDQNPYRYTTQDKIIDAVMVAGVIAAIYGLLAAVGC